MAIADTITSMQTHTSNAYTTIGYGTDLTGINKNLANLSSTIKEAFLESLRTPDTLFTNLPKKSGTGSVISLNDTANAPMRITLSPTELTQSGTPTPSSPQDIHTISGSNTIKVEGANLFNKSEMTTGKSVSTSNGSLYNDANSFSTGFINVYGLSYVSKSGFSANNKTTWGAFYKQDKTYLSAMNVGANATKFSIPTGAYYVRIGFLNEYLDDLMINPGETLLSYTPYTSQEQEVDLGYENVLDLYRYPYNKVDSDLYGGEVYIENGIITIDGTNATSNMTARSLSPASGKRDIIKAGTYYFNVRCNLRTISDNTLYQPTIGINTLAEDYYIQQWFATTQVGKITTYKMQIVEGNEDVPYTEYGKAIEYSKISTYEDKFIRTSGKNLLDTQYYQQGSIDSSTGQDTANSYNARGSNYIPVQPNTTYTISCNKIVNSLRLSEYTSSKTNIQRNSLSGASLTITTTANTYYVRWSLNYDNSTTMTQTIVDSLNLMLNKGTTALPYEPYGSNEWYIKKNIGKVVLDGTEDWEYYSGSSIPFRLTLTDLQTTPNDDTMPYFKTNYYETKVYNNASGNSYVTCANNNTKLRFRNSSISTLEDFKTWLGTHNTIVYYVLATPTYTQITGTLETQLENVYQKLLSYDNTTNISQVNNDLSFNMSVQAIER